MPQIRANGIDIEYESFGRDSDPAILLIMGFSGQLFFRSRFWITILIHTNKKK